MCKNYTIRILLLFLLLISQDMFAQTEFCATDILHQQKLASDPIYKANFEKKQLSLQKRIAEKMANDAVSKTENTVYQIPVVVHIIHTGDPIGSILNPGKNTIEVLINKLNEDFRATNTGTDTEIEFVLAKRSPDCTPTTGINRIDGSILPGYVENGIEFDLEIGVVFDEEIKGLSTWSNIDYYNIWIVNKIDMGLAGYATFPIEDPQLDGIVLSAQKLYNFVSLMTHEIGHGLFLYHTFHRAENVVDGFSRDSSGPTDCPENTNCATQGDMVCDTDPHSLFYGACVTENCGRTVSQTTLSNYMSYCETTDNFTPDQKTRMRTTLEIFRGGLLTSLGATPPSSILPVSACIPTNTGLKSNVGITRFVLDKLNIFSHDSEMEGKNYFDRVCNQEIKLDAGSEHPIKVETSTTPHNVKVYVDYNNDGDFTDINEEVASGSTEEIEGIHTFNTIYQVPYSDVLFNKPLRMRVVASAITDGIATSCEVFKGEAEDYSLTIKKIACSIDSVEIGTQSECNSETNSYTQSLLVTYSNQPPTGNLVVNGQSFSITESPQTITLTNLIADGKEVDIVANFSDDIDCKFTQNSVFTAPLRCGSINSNISVYPNPTPNEFSYTLKTEQEGEHTIRVFDAIGKLIFEENKIKTGVSLEGIINLEKYAKGLYLLQISDSKKTTTVRVVKE